MADSTTCPFCNAVIATPAPDPASGKVHCPRCGETFPSKNLAQVAPGAPPSRISAEVQRHRQARQVSGWRSTRGLIIGGVILAALGLGVGFAINHLNRGSKSETPHIEVDTSKPVAPLDMPGLRYLPAGTDSVVAVQFRPLLDALPNGQARNPRALLTWIGLPKDAIDGVEKIVPIGLDNIDQLVLGLKVTDGVLLKQIVLVVHTRAAFSMDSIVAGLDAKELKSGDRRIYQVTGSPKSFFVDLCLWAPNDRVLVVALETKEIEASHHGIDHLAPRLVETAQQQFAPDTYFWAVLDSERWEILGLPLLRMLAPEQRLVFEKFNISLSVVRTVTLAVRTDPEPSLTVGFEMKAEKTAEEFRTYLTDRLKDDADRVTVGGAGNRVMVRTSIQGGELRGLIQKLLPLAKKN